MRMKLRRDACRKGCPVCWSVLREKKRSSSASCFSDGGERHDGGGDTEQRGDREKREAVMSTVSSALFSYMKPYDASSCELVFSP
jgi:hypothetical protein